jgi:chromosomal replication initiation ATPase DnaA
MNEKMYSKASVTGSLKDIGTYFGIGESGVSQACRRVEDKIRNDKKLGRKIAKIEKRLNMSRMKT